MERLTIKIKNGYFFRLPNVSDRKAQDEYIEKLSKKIGEYEDAEEQGLLLRLPCKVGDTVYSVVKDGLQIIELKFSLELYARRMSDFGKTVFLTKEEAEQALADMKGGGEYAENN